SEKPGYGYQLKMGATSLTEKWDAGVGNFGSQNHFMLGQINEWFFHDLAGIAPDPSGSGFKKILVRPAIVGSLTNVRARYQSVRGPISTEWKRAGDRLQLDVTIPPNTTATVFIPAGTANAVTEGGRLATESPGVKFIGLQSGNGIFEIASGHYSFLSTLPPASAAAK
ncbi:MAG: alpha-L-rhamnosidase, partial [Akkermansiaceae bacterium]|nr:alpha-L-rhamnosidase [Verrucomicrobiales bacterium]